MSEGIYKRNGIWFVRFRYLDQDGRPRNFRHSTGLGTSERDAVALRAKWMHESRRLGYVPGFEDAGEPVESSGMTFTGFAKYWIDTHAIPNNSYNEVLSKRSSMKHHLAPFFGDTDIRDITVAMVERFKAVTIKKGLTKKSVNVYLGVLRTMLNHATEWGYIDSAPKIKGYKVEQEDPDFYTLEERDLFLETCRRLRPEWHALFFTAFHTGMRMGELKALRWEDIDFAGSKIRVRRSKSRGPEKAPKSGRARTVPMNSELLRVLKGHRHLRSDLVFLNSVGKPLDINGGRKVFKSICRLAGLRSIRLHDMRHSFGSNLAAATGNLLAVQNILGHADIQTTMRYAHLTGAQHRDAVEALVSRPDEDDDADTGTGE